MTSPVVVLFGGTTHPTMVIVILIIKLCVLDTS